MLALARRSSEPAADKFHCFGGGIAHHHDQHALVDVDSCYVVGHCFLSGEEAADRAKLWITHPFVLMPFLDRKGNVTFIDSSRAFRIKLPDGLNLSRAVSTSPVPRPLQHTGALHQFS